MKRMAALLLLITAGCSTSPLADVLDFVKPGRLPSGPRRYYGGADALPSPQPVNPPASSLPIPPPPDPVRPP
jgi:hypothetical protein